MAPRRVYTEEELTNPDVAPEPWEDSVGVSGWNWCKPCARWLTHGSPSHATSPLCRSGGRPHCSCSACF